MKFDRLSRRMVLQGAAGSWLSIPLLTSLVPERAVAQAGGAPKRFISIISNYDMGHHANWLPNAMASVNDIPPPSRVFSPGNGHPDVRYQPLQDFVATSTSELSPIAGNHFNPYLSSMTIMRSLNHTMRYGHGAAYTLGSVSPVDDNVRGLPRIETMDVVLNKNRTFNPAGLPMTFAGEHGYGPDSYSHAATAGSVSNNAWLGDQLLALYNRLFSNGNLPESGRTTPTRHPRYDLLSRVQEDYLRVRNSRRLSAGDRAALDNALDQFRDTQRSLERVATSSCQHRGLTRTGSFAQVPVDANVGRALADIVTAAIMCDASRAFTLGVEHLGGDLDGQLPGHGPVSHEPFRLFGTRRGWQITAERKRAIIRNFVAPLVQRLSAATDPTNGRSYLYNSLVYFTAQSGLSHGHASHPVMLFGNAGGALSSGNYLDYAIRGATPAFNAFSGGDLWGTSPGTDTFSNNWYGASYNRLLVTILQAMGLQPAEYENDAVNAQLYNRTNLGPNAANLTSLGGFGYYVGHDLAHADYRIGDNLRNAIAAQDPRLFRRPLPMP
jgi:hypothetical protein